MCKIILYCPKYLFIHLTDVGMALRERHEQKFGFILFFFRFSVILDGVGLGTGWGTGWVLGVGVGVGTG